MLPNGVGVPTSRGVSFKNIPPNTPLVLVLSLPVAPLPPNTAPRTVCLGCEPVSGKGFSGLVPEVLALHVPLPCKSYRKASAGIKEHVHQ